MPGTWEVANLSSSRSIKAQWFQGIENSFMAA